MEDHLEFLCPYCGQLNTLAVDASGGSKQSFVTDCEVCCQPIACRLMVSGASDDKDEQPFFLEVRREDEV
jgi:hypothetical protein